MDAEMDEVLVQIVEEYPEWTLTQLKAAQLQVRPPHTVFSAKATMPLALVLVAPSI